MPPRSSPLDALGAALGPVLREVATKVVRAGAKAALDEVDRGLRSARRAVSRTQDRVDGKTVPDDVIEAEFEDA